MVNVLDSRGVVPVTVIYVVYINGVRHDIGEVLGVLVFLHPQDKACNSGTMFM